ncbi:acyl-CoA dehydrogenase family protein [Amycolatopsis pithecellobii]|uniref:Acyl-CoA dehydrogenase/oxidase C-terminal domain-containing protein n=1 Tax=Amycolatopsis pithecellobii TaxID=664692 RepID=A0A6N7YMT4_9PSEU|nr:acyl-CoA dehydrogenase family protein [Amycolatopsis pithecellobii]MTD53178.1 hypothetical protein [Amycolatopsis pithecellobii]
MSDAATKLGLSRDTWEIAQAVRAVLADVMASHPLRVEPDETVRRTRLTELHAVLTEGSWAEVALGEFGLLTAVAEVAATVPATPAYPLVEMWLAHRVLDRLGRRDIAEPGRLVVADVTAPLEPDGDAGVPFGPFTDVVLRLEPRWDKDFDVLAVEASGAQWTLLDDTDATRPLHTPAPGAVTGLGVLRTEDALTIAAEFAVLEAAEMLGCADTLFRATVRHVSHREQFGKPLSANQVVRHRMADAYTQLESVRSLVRYAGWVADTDASRLGEFAFVAKGLAGEYCWDVLDEAFQLHGAIGCTAELGLQHPAARIMTRTMSPPTSADCLVRTGSAVLARGSIAALLEET